MCRFTEDMSQQTHCMLTIRVWVHIFDTLSSLSIKMVHWCVFQPSRIIDENKHEHEQPDSIIVHGACRATLGFIALRRHGI